MRTLALVALLLGTSVAHAGETHGPLVISGVLAKTSYKKHTMRFTKGEAFVTVTSSGKNDLDCYAYDAEGEVLAHDTSVGPNCLLHWEAPTEQPVLVTVWNQGSTSTTYTLVTN